MQVFPEVLNANSTTQQEPATFRWPLYRHAPSRSFPRVSVTRSSAISPYGSINVLHHTNFSRATSFRTVSRTSTSVFLTQFHNPSFARYPMKSTELPKYQETSIRPRWALERKPLSAKCGLTSGSLLTGYVFGRNRQYSGPSCAFF